MKQAVFEERFAERWNAFASWLDRRASAAGASGAAASGAAASGAAASGAAPPASDGFPDDEFPQRYREICHHLALARDRQYGSDLVERLNSLALRGHHVLYRAAPSPFPAFVDFIAAGFPRLVREEWRATLAAMALFFVPLIGITALVALYPDSAYYLIDPRNLSRFQDMYSDAAQALGRHGAEGDLTAFAFYIFNNISIGFQTFATGILLGLGTVFFLLSNGMQLGAVAGYLSSVGLGHNFWSFVAGHSGPELLAIGVSGAAGFRLAQALLAPGRYSRKQAIVIAGRRAVLLMIGASGLFLLAAFIEGFWSAHRWFGNEVKYAAGLALWALLIAYLLLAGRGSGRPERP